MPNNEPIMMKIATAVLTMAILYFYGRFVYGLVNDGYYLIVVGLIIAPFIWGRWVSTDWEREQDDKNFAAWKQKWRFRFSRIWPTSGEVLPPVKELPSRDQGAPLKLP